jgi:nicotinamidase-related amidase/type 1 glutamine amidotransferase
MFRPRRIRSLTVTLVAAAAIPGFFALAETVGRADDRPAAIFDLSLRYQTETSPGSGRYHTVQRVDSWDPAKTALIVCDVWDLHHCLNAVRRVEEFGPRLNEVVKAARERGITIIHAPSDCMEAYVDHPARKRAMTVPKAAVLPEEITSWCSRIPAEEKGVYPIDQSDGGEDDDPAEHAEWAAKLTALGRNPKAPWKKQSDLIEIDGERDYISDRGDEVWSILASHGIENVILSGVHTNMCVLGRPFGLRQMAKNEKNVVLMRDMTDTMYNPQMWPYVSHFSGTDLIVSHIEKFVCPTIASNQIIGGEPHRFKHDKRPHLVIVMAEDEYETERTLPVFAGNNLGKDFRISYVFGSDTERGDIPGLDVLEEADLALISVRRRPLKPQQLAIVRQFVDAGKPLVGIRTASHAFCLRNQPPPEGLADWPEFDAQVWGGHYTNHYGNDLQCRVRIVPEQKGHPILTGVRTDEFDAGGSLYVVSPLDEKATVLMTGRVEGKPAEPVAYTFQRADGGRSFYASLGYKTDLEANPDIQRLLLNGIYWAAGLAPPAEFHVTGTIDDYRRGWVAMPVPADWDAGSRGVLKDYRGVGWYRCMVRVPADWEGMELGLRTGTGDKDELRAFFNGEELDKSEVFGARDPLVDGGYLISVPPEIVLAGDVNVLTIRVHDQDGTGGLRFLHPVMATGGESIGLSGRWEFRIGDDPSFTAPPLPPKFAASTSALFERQSD